MSLTFNAQITIDDVTLAALRGGGNVVVPVPLPTPTPTPASRKLHFGYYGALAGQREETADHATFTFAPGWDGSGLPLTGPTVLFAPSGEPRMLPKRR